MTPGQRIGRYVLLVDSDGMRHAIAISAALALCELDGGGTVLMLPGGKMVRLEADLDDVLLWLNS